MPPFGNELLIRLTIVFFLLLCLSVVLVVSRLGFEGGNLILIAPTPGHCLPFTFPAYVLFIFAIGAVRFKIISLIKAK